VGFNNICEARVLLFTEKRESHSCSGSDSSLLLVAATTGLSGLMVFLFMGYKLTNMIKNDFYGTSFKALSTALFVHSFFVNSLFYPFVMGFMGLVLSCAYSDRGKFKESKRE